MASLVTALGQKIVSAGKESLTGFAQGAKGAFVSANPAVFGPAISYLEKSLGSKASKEKTEDRRREKEKEQRSQGFFEENFMEDRKLQQDTLSNIVGINKNTASIDRTAKEILEVLKKCCMCKEEGLNIPLLIPPLPDGTVSRRTPGSRGPGGRGGRVNVPEEMRRPPSLPDERLPRGRAPVTEAPPRFRPPIIEAPRVRVPAIDAPPRFRPPALDEVPRFRAPALERPPRTAPFEEPRYRPPALEAPRAPGSAPETIRLGRQPLALPPPDTSFIDDLNKSLLDMNKSFQKVKVSIESMTDELKVFSSVVNELKGSIGAVGRGLPGGLGAGGIPRFSSGSMGGFPSLPGGLGAGGFPRLPYGGGGGMGGFIPALPAPDFPGSYPIVTTPGEGVPPGAETRPRFVPRGLAPGPIEEAVVRESFVEKIRTFFSGIYERVSTSFMNFLQKQFEPLRGTTFFAGITGEGGFIESAKTQILGLFETARASIVGKFLVGIIRILGAPLVQGVLAAIDGILTSFNDDMLTAMFNTKAEELNLRQRITGFLGGFFGNILGFIPDALVALSTWLYEKITDTKVDYNFGKIMDILKIGVGKVFGVIVGALAFDEKLIAQSIGMEDAMLNDKIEGFFRTIGNILIDGINYSMEKIIDAVPDTIGFEGTRFSIDMRERKARAKSAVRIENIDKPVVSNVQRMETYLGNTPKDAFDVDYSKPWTASAIPVPDLGMWNPGNASADMAKRGIYTPDASAGGGRGSVSAYLGDTNERPINFSASEGDVQGREGWLKVYAAAAAAGDKFPEITASQWALESGWGKRMPKGSNNPFGIKAKTQNGVPTEPYVMAATTEWSESQGYYRDQAAFKQYGSINEAITDRVSRWSPRYASASTTDDALKALVATKYATDPQYFSSLQSIITKQTGLGLPPASVMNAYANPEQSKAVIQTADASQASAKTQEQILAEQREARAVESEYQRMRRDWEFGETKARIEQYKEQAVQWKKQEEDRQYVKRREALFEEFNNNMKGIFRPMVDALMGPANTMSAAFNKGAGTNLSKALLDDFTKMGTKIFGQQYGPAMGSVFQRLAGVYMDQFIDKTLAPMLGINSDILNRSINTYLEGRSKFKQAISQAGAAVTSAKAALTEAEKKAGISTAEIVKASMPTVLGGKGFTSEQMSKISQLNSLRKNVETAEANLAAQKAQRRQYNTAAMEDLMYGMTGIPFGPRSLIEAYGGGEKLTQDLATFFGSPIKPVFGLDEKDNRRLQAEDSLNRNYLTGQSKLLGNNLDAQAKLNAANATRLERVGDVWAEKVSYALSSGMSSGGGSVGSAFNALVRQASPVYGSNETPTLLPGANVDEYGIPFLSSAPINTYDYGADIANTYGVEHAIQQNTYQLQDVSSSLGKVDFSLASVKDSNLKLGDSTKSLTDTFGGGLKIPTPAGGGGTLKLPSGQVIGPSAGSNLGNFGMNLFGTMLGARAAQGIGVQNPMVNQMFMRFGSDLFSGKNPMGNLKAGFGQAGAGGLGNALSGIMGLKYGNTSTLGGTLGTALAAYQTVGAIKSLMAGGSSVGALTSGISSLGTGIQTVGNFLGSSSISAFGGGMAGTTMAVPAGTTAAQAAMLEANGVILAEGAAGTAATAGASAGSTMAAAAPYVLGAIGGHYLGRSISGGYAAGGGSGNTAVNAGTAIGMALGGPLGAVVGGAIGGLVNRAFGKKIDQIGSGLMGTLSNQNTDVTGYKEERTKYGFFRFKSDDFNTSAVALDPETAAAFKGITKDITKSIKSIGRMFDFNLDRFNDTYKESIKLNLQNAKTEEERQKIITDAFQKFGSNLVDFTLGSTGIAGFTRPGEDSLEALTRLATGRQAWLTMSAMGKNAPSFTGINEAGIARLFGYQVTDETNAGVTTKKYTLKDGLISGLNYGDLSRILNVDVGSAELQRGIADFLAGGRGEVTGKRAVSGTTQVPGSIYTQTGWGDSFDYSWVEGMVDEIVNGFADITVSIKDSLALYTADLSSKIIEEFGGDEKFNATMNKYIDLFYSAEEKLQMQKDSANTALQNAMDDLKDLGLQNLPSFANTTQESANNYRTYVDSWIKSVGGLIGIDTAEERAIYRTLTEAGITFMDAANINLNAANINAGTANVNYAAANTFIPSLDFYGNKIVSNDAVPVANNAPVANTAGPGANTVVTLPDTSVGPQLPGANNVPVTPQTPTTVAGKTLPSNWSTFSAADKIKWYNDNSITPDMLKAAGVTQTELDWMLQPQNGYTGSPFVATTDPNFVGPINNNTNVVPASTSNPITETFLTADRENRQLDSVQREVSVNTAMVDNSVTNVNNSPRTTIIGGDDYRDEHPVFGGGRKLIYSRAYD